MFCFRSFELRFSSWTTLQLLPVKNAIISCMPVCFHFLWMQLQTTKPSSSLPQSKVNSRLFRQPFIDNLKSLCWKYISSHYNIIADSLSCIYGLLFFYALYTFLSILPACWNQCFCWLFLVPSDTLGLPRHPANSIHVFLLKTRSSQPAYQSTPTSTPTKHTLMPFQAFAISH